MKKTLIQRIEVGSGGAASITFSAIPDTYTDLFLVASTRISGTATDPQSIIFNGDTGTNYSMRMLYGSGSSAGSASNANYLAQYNNWAIWWMQTSSTTANTFGNTSLYIPNYALTTQHKSVSVDTVTENNGTAANQQIGAGIWRNNAAITSLTITPYSSNFVQYSSATLYGITAGSDGTTTVS